MATTVDAVAVRESARTIIHMEYSQDLLWYVSYGSNMCAQRFACYIRGGTPVGSTRTYLGSRDPSWPLESTPWDMPGSICFAGNFTVWDPAGCGAAFYDPLEEGPSRGRAWLLTRRQFMDVIAQENGQEAGDLDFVLAGALNQDEEQVTVGTGAYDLLVRCGQKNGYPAWTLTGSLKPEQRGLKAPSLAYLRMLANGLVETTGITDAEALTYLKSRKGA